MGWKAFFVVELCLLLFAVLDVQGWSLLSVFLLAVSFGRIFATFSYAFDETRSFSPYFWRLFRWAYLIWVTIVVSRVVASLTAGLQYGIFPAIGPGYVSKLAIVVAALSSLVWAEWTAITRLSRGETARRFEADKA